MKSMIFRVVLVAVFISSSVSVCILAYLKSIIPLFVFLLKMFYHLETVYLSLISTNLLPIYYLE